MGDKFSKCVGFMPIITDEEAMNVFCFFHVCSRANSGGGTVDIRDYALSHT